MKINCRNNLGSYLNFTKNNTTYWVFSFKRLKYLLLLLIFSFDAVIAGQRFSSPDDERRPLLSLNVVHDTNTDQSRVKQWLSEDVFRKQKKTSTPIMIFEVLSGGARGAVYCKLGYVLSERVLDGLSAASRHAISSIYAAGASIPMICLGARSSGRVLGKLFSPSSVNERAIEKKSSCASMVKNGLWNTIVILGGITSSSTMTYLTYAEFKDDIGWGWLAPGIPTFYVRTLIDYDAINDLYDSLLYFAQVRYLDKKVLQSPTEHSPKAVSLASMRRILRNAELYIEALDANQSETLLKRILEKTQSEDKLSCLIFPQSQFPDKDQPSEESYSQLGASLLGAAIGVYGLWMYYPVTISSFDFTSSIFDLQDEQQQQLQQSLSIISLGTASAITAVSSYSSARKCYAQAVSLYENVTQFFKGDLVQPNLTTDKKHRSFRNKRILIGAAAAFFATCNSSMQSEVAIEFLDLDKINSRLELSAIIFSQFALCFWAVDELLLEFLHSTDPKGILMKKLVLLRKKIGGLSTDSLEELQQIFQDCNA